MKQFIRRIVVRGGSWVVGTAGWVWAAAAADLPPAAAGPIQFSRDIRPILEASCVKCHGRGKAQGRFSLETREALMRGGSSGEAVVVGRSGESYLIELVAGVDPDNVMPAKGNRLTAEEVGLLRAWIDAGLAWDEGVSFAKPPARNLQVHRPELPLVSAEGDHPVDRLLAPYYAEQGVEAPQAVSDRVLARRVYLDLIGLLPTPEELRTFVEDEGADKRGRLVDRLLADRQRYAEHWLSFWNDLLRNDYRGTGYIDGGRKQISAWLFAALADNKPYDRFVAELISPTADSEGFIKGIVWRGVVNASQRPEMQAAQNVSQVFMGVNLKCASCHDSFIDDWTLAESYALANVFADQPLEVYQCDRPTGQLAGMGFLFPELGAIPADASRVERQQRLAQIMTGPDNGRLTRTVVNRLWQRFMGRGLVEPVDDMQQPAWHPDLLDWLAEDLAAHGYDLKHTMKRIVTSRAYQRPAVGLPERAASNYVFRGPAIRRLSAEQFRDALGAMTGFWYDQAEGSLEVAKALASEQRPEWRGKEPRWIWAEAEAAAKTRPGPVYWRKTFTLEARPEEATLVATCDNRFTLYLNGEKVLAGDDFTTPKVALVRDQMRPGPNLLAVEAINDPAGDASAGATNDQAASNPAGLLVFLEMRGDDAAQAVVSDASWQWSRDAVEGWQQPAVLIADTWPHAAELGRPDAGPWNLGAKFQAALAMADAHHEVRASLVPTDPLMTALGRPPREQLHTTRDAAATTLQSLELTNGDTLTRVLQQGAARLLADRPPSDPALVDDVFAKALGRSPTREERALALELVGDPLRKEGLEDLLWSVAMLPEFQLIY